MLTISQLVYSSLNNIPHANSCSLLAVKDVLFRYM